MVIGPASKSPTSHKNRTIAEVEEAKSYGITIEQYHELSTLLEARWREKAQANIEYDFTESLKKSIRKELRPEVIDEMRAELEKAWTKDKRQEVEKQIRVEQEKRLVTEQERATVVDHVLRLRLEALVVSEACLIEADGLVKASNKTRLPLVTVAALWPLLVYLSWTHYGALACAAVALSMSLLARGVYVKLPDREENLRRQAREAREYADHYEHEARVIIPMATYVSDLRSCGNSREFRNTLPSPDAMDTARRMLENRDALGLDTRTLLEHRREAPRLPG